MQTFTEHIFVEIATYIHLFNYSTARPKNLNQSGGSGCFLLEAEASSTKTTASVSNCLTLIYAQITSTTRQRSDFFGLRVELPPVTTSITTQR